MPAHWVNDAAVVTAVRGYAIPEFKAEASSPELMTAELNMHVDALEQMYAAEFAGNANILDDVNINASPQIIRRKIREFRVLARLCWKGKALEYWGNVVIGTHSRVYDTNGQLIGSAYPPATLHAQAYVHPSNQAAGAIQYPGYEDLLSVAQGWAQRRGEAPKYDKIDWKEAKYDGSAATLTQWEQTVNALAKAKNLPDNLPMLYKVQVVHGIAAQFTGLAADAWSKEANKPTQIHSNNGELGIVDWCRQRFLSHSYAQEKF